MIRAVLLDALGTLVELEDPAPRLVDGLERRGVDVTLERARAALSSEIAYYRRHHLEAADRAGLAALRHDCSTVLADELPEASGLAREELERALLEALSFRAFDDAAPALAQLRERGIRLVVVSNWDVSLHDALAQTGLRSLIDGAISSAEAGAPKPAAAIFDRGLEIAGVDRSEALMVGDDVDADVGGARAAGISALLIDRAARPARDRFPHRAGAGPAVIGSLAELAGHVQFLP